MATDIMTTVETAYAIATITGAESLGAFEANTIMTHFVNRDYNNNIADYGDTVDISVRGNVVVNDKAEGSDVTFQNPSLTKISVVLNKHKEVSLKQSDLSKALSRPDLFKGYIRDAAIALAEQVDKDLLATYAGFSQSIDATSTFDAGTFREAARKLNVAKAPMTNRYMILHPDAYAMASSWDVFTNSDYQGPEAYEAVKRGFLGQYAGFNTHMSQLVTQTGGENKNIAFHRDAITLVTRPLPTSTIGVIQVVMVENGFPIRVTISYDHPSQTNRVTLDTLYGIAEHRDLFGITVRTDAV